MNIEVIHDKAALFNFLKTDLGNQLYLVGDLDDFFWPKTIWFAAKDKGIIKSVALLYVAMDTPTLLLFGNNNSTYPTQLLKQVKPYLPERLIVHLSSGLLDIFGSHSVLKYYGLDYKMVLTQPVVSASDPNIRKLSTQDLEIVKELYSLAYPNNWFDSRMLGTGKYFGYFINSKLVGVSGVHVYSREFRVAALGNIATHPHYRGQKVCYKLTSALCSHLQQHVDTIGLNVRSDNEHAISCYKKIGFEVIGSCDECLVRNIL